MRKEEKEYWRVVLSVCAPFAYLAVVLFGGIWLTHRPSEAQSVVQQSATVQCPSGQKPSVINLTSTSIRVVCIPSSATPTPTITPTPTPTVTPTPTPQPAPTPQPSPSVGVELPRVLLNSSMPALSGITRQVFASNNLQTVIDAAQRGDTLIVESGATFTGNYTLPAKTGIGWIVIRSSGLGALPEGVRVSPSQFASMAKIVAKDSTPAFSTKPGASGWRLVGLEISHTTAAITTIVRIGDWAATTQAASAADIGIDRCFIHGSSTSNTRRGVEMHGARVFVVDSYISDVHEVGADSQAICGWNGGGPFKIVGNYLEGAGENLMFGGADPSIKDLIPSDIEIRRNTFSKPLAWKSSSWSIKNLFELKAGQRVLIDGNVFENIWPAAQAGFAVNLKSVSQDNTSPWSRTENITFTNNVIKNAFGGVSLLGTDSGQPAVKMNKVLIRNNVFEINGTYAFYVSDVADLTIDKNTITNTGSILQTSGSPSQRFVYTGNIARNGEYGFKGDGAAPGLGTLAAYFPACVFVNNVLSGANLATYPAGNFNTLTPGTGADLAQIVIAQGRP